MSLVKKVLWERIINQVIIEEPNNRISLDGSNVIWSAAQYLDHQEWLFGGGASLVNFSMTNTGALTDTINGHPGVPVKEITQKDVDFIQGAIKAVRACYASFPEGTPGPGYDQFDVFGVVNLKMNWMRNQLEGGSENLLGGSGY